MPINALYQKQLDSMLTDPNSFQGTPGFQFALNTGLDSVNRSNSRMRGSGNALAALTKYGTGLASQNYGNQRDFLGKMVGQEQNYGLGEVANQNAATRNANDLTLGLGANANAASRNANDLTLGQGANANTARANDQNFGLGMYQAGNQYDLGMTNANNTAQNNWWNYMLGGQANNNQAANNQNNYNLGLGRNAIDWFGANTNRGTAQSNAWMNDQTNQLNWFKNAPKQVYA